MNPGICYLYEYKNDQKLRNVGFMKVTPHYHACILQINVRGVPVKNQDFVSLLTFYEKDSGIIAKPVEKLPCGDKSIYARLSVDESVFPEGRTLAEMGGFLLQTEAGQYYAAFTDNLPFNTASIRPWEAAPEPVMEAESLGGCPCILPNDEAAEETSVVNLEMSLDTEMAVEKAAPHASNYESAIQDDSTIQRNYDTDRENPPENRNNHGNGNYPNFGNYLNNDSNSNLERFPSNEIDLNDLNRENLLLNENDSVQENLPVIENDSGQEHLPAAENNSRQENLPGNGNIPDLENTPVNIPYPARDSAPQPESFPVPEYMPENAPSPEPVSVPEPEPQSRETVHKIQRSDLSMLPRRCWNLANNSFLMHGYHNYHHLLLVEEDGHFWLGVPGIYAPREARAAELFGFPQFTQTYTSQLDLSSDECEDSEKFGYWCRFIR